MPGIFDDIAAETERLREVSKSNDMLGDGLKIFNQFKADLNINTEGDQRRMTTKEAVNTAEGDDLYSKKVSDYFIIIFQMLGIYL